MGSSLALRIERKRVRSVVLPTKRRWRAALRRSASRVAIGHPSECVNPCDSNAGVGAYCDLVGGPDIQKLQPTREGYYVRSPYISIQSEQVSSLNGGRLVMGHAC